MALLGGLLRRRHEVSTIGSYLAKAVFQAHGALATGAVAFRKKPCSDQVLAFLSAKAISVVAIEACASAHH